MSTTHAIRINQCGGPEQLMWQEVPLPPPGPGEVQVRNIAVGVNYIDTYHRSGLYPVQLPSGLGLEAAGVIEALGDGVSGWQVGDRVAHGTGPLGAYAQRRNLPAQFLVRIPAGVEDASAAALMLQGMTVEYLIHRTYPVSKGDWVLFHAAAGGVGSLAVQWLLQLGARVVATAGSPEKRERVRGLGCEHVVDYRAEDWVSRVREITGGEGVAVAYDGVGRDTFMGSLDCLRTRGMLVSFGNASGAPPEVQPLLLSQKGSLFLTRPTLAHYAGTPEDLALSAGRVMDAAQAGVIKAQIGTRLPLAEAAEAHRALEARRTTGSIVLLP